MARWGRVATGAARFVYHTIGEVEDACLADILLASTGLAALGLLEASTGPRLPAKDGKGTLADLALVSVWCTRHANVRVLAKACLTEDREFRALPSCLVDV